MARNMIERTFEVYEQTMAMRGNRGPDRALTAATT
jgi:hypothetical protein